MDKLNCHLTSGGNTFGMGKQLFGFLKLFLKLVIIKGEPSFFKNSFNSVVEQFSIDRSDQISLNPSA